MRHYPTGRCWDVHFQPPRYSHPKPRRVRTPTGYRVLNNPEYRDSTDRILRQAERILASNPGLLRDFLGNIGLNLQPILFVDDSSGYDDEEDVMWSGSPEAWRQHVEERRAAIGPTVEPEPWNWRLVLGTQLASGYRDGGRPMRPYERSMEVLRERGWVSNPIRLTPSADNVLRQAARILAASPGLADEFLDNLLYDGRLPIPLIHKLYAELMRYDLMEKLPVWIVEREHDPHPDERIGVYGTRARAVAGAAGDAANVAAHYRLYALAEQLETLVQQGYAHLNEEDESRAALAFTEAVELFNAQAFNHMRFVVSQALIE